MPTKRRLWAELSPTYQKRLQAKGITAETHAAGVSISKARGQHSHGEHGGARAKALKKGITEFVPNYKKLERAEQERIGTAYLTTWTRGKGEIKNPKRKKGQRIRRDRDENQVIQEMIWERYLKERELGSLDAAYYKQFRSMYQYGFTS